MVQLCQALVESNEAAHAQRMEKLDARLTELGEVVRASGIVFMLRSSLIPSGF